MPYIELYVRDIFSSATRIKTKTVPTKRFVKRSTFRAWYMHSDKFLRIVRSKGNIYRTRFVTHTLFRAHIASIDALISVMFISKIRVDISREKLLLTVNAGLPWIRIIPLFVSRRLALLVVSPLVIILLVLRTGIHSPSLGELAPLRV